MQSNPRIPYRFSSKGSDISHPKGKSIIVHIVVNLEHWQFGEPMPRKILPAPQGLELVPDIPNFCWAEYGMRCGMPRLLDLFNSKDVPVSASINASVVDVYSECAQEILEAGWEFIAHGVHQRVVDDQMDERELIKYAIDKLETFSKTKVRGWLSPGLRESFNTPDLLQEAGIEFIFDWILDDLPCWMTTKNGRILAMPYSPEINDSVIYAVEKHSSSEMFRRLKDALRWFDNELEREPRIITIGLHPHLIAVPHRIIYLQEMIDLLQNREDVVFMNASQIADWFIEVDDRT